MTKLRVLFKVTLFLFATFIIIQSCNKEDDRIEEEKVKLQEYLEANNYSGIEPTSSGLYYVVLTESDGASPQISDYVKIKFTGSLVDGTVFETSDSTLAVSEGIVREDKLYGPAKFSLENIGIPGLREGLMLMNEGGESKIIIPSNLAFGGTDYGIIPPYSTLIYDVELLDVISDPEEHEQQLLNSYIEENEYTGIEPTSSGLYYIEQEAGTGDLPGDNDIVRVHYVGSLIDGRIFDQSKSESESGSPLVINMSSTNVIPGFIEGVSKMRENGKARIIVPWNLGYGPNGSSDGIIPPYSTLVFDLEIVDIE